LAAKYAKNPELKAQAAAKRKATILARYGTDFYSNVKRGKLKKRRGVIR
jgi:hypothetical protein